MRVHLHTHVVASLALGLTLASPAVWASPVGATATGNVSGSFYVGCTT